MAYRIIRFVLKAIDAEREVGLVRDSPITYGPTPKIGDIVQVNHHGPAFEAKVVWIGLGVEVPDRLRVVEI